MNKKIVFISGLVIIVAGLLFMTMRKEKETPPRIKTAEDEMPDFNFELIDGGFIQRANIDDTKYTLMWFINSECDLCLVEVQALVDSISLLDNCQILLVSYEDTDKVVEFNERFRLSKFPSIDVAYVTEETINTMFKIYVLPTLYVYHPDRRMLKYKPGPVTIQEIVQYLK